MFETLLSARNGTLKNIAGACTGSQEFRDLLNEATRRLMRRGDFVDTVVPLHVCVRNGCVVFNRYVGQVRKINVCNHPVPVTNMYGDFISHSDYQHTCGCECRMTPYGKTPTYSSIWGEARYIRAYPRTSTDVGKFVTIFGVDNGNQPLFTDNADGTRSDGIILQLVEPYAQTTTFVRRIDRILLDEMEGQVLLYGFDSVNSVLEDLAVYDPGETNPEYTRYQLHSIPHGAQSINALVKLRFIPARFDNDLVLISNLDALKDMIQAIKLREAGDINGAVGMETLAIKELNHQIADEFPLDQVPIVHGLGFYTGQHVR